MLRSLRLYSNPWHLHPSTSTTTRNVTTDRPIKGDLPSTNDAHFVEKGWDAYWTHRRRLQHGHERDGRHFSMVLPPPNVTGKLHLGHALTVAIEDTIVRWRRLHGDREFCVHVGRGL